MINSFSLSWFTELEKHKTFELKGLLEVIYSNFCPSEDVTVLRVQVVITHLLCRRCSNETCVKAAEVMPLADMHRAFSMTLLLTSGGGIPWGPGLSRGWEAETMGKEQRVIKSGLPRRLQSLHPGTFSGSADVSSAVQLHYFTSSRDHRAGKRQFSLELWTTGLPCGEREWKFLTLSWAVQSTAFMNLWNMNKLILVL